MSQRSLPRIFLLCICVGLLLPASLRAGAASPAQKPAAPAMPQWSACGEGLGRGQLRTLAFEALRTSYPDFNFRLEDNRLIFPDGSSLIFDDGRERTRQELLDDPDIFDMFFYCYPSSDYRKKAQAAAGMASAAARDSGLTLPTSIPYPSDPGRVRNESFFRKMYGSTEGAVKRRLAPVRWIPSGKGPTLMVTTVNGVDKALQAVSDELDKIPGLRPYLLHPGGTFTWRVIAGTDRLSVHSFGAAVDINVARSNYWHYIVHDEEAPVVYRNRIPSKIVAVFERHGFIWGGWWYHFDTMHFEYRPEIIAYMHLLERARKEKEGGSGHLGRGAE